MNRLLKRQIKRYFGNDFDVDKSSDELKGFIDLVSNSYEDYSKEIKLMQRTLEINSDELTQANRLIKNKNLDMVVLLEQYKSAIDTALIVSKTNLNGIITYTNNRFCELSGYRTEELIGKSHNIVRHEDTDAEVYKDLWHTIQSKKIWKGLLTNRAKNGEPYYVNATIFPILNTKNEIVEYMAIREDITESILLQKRTEDLSNRTAQILNAQESIIVISDAIQGISEVNQMFFDLSGFSNLKDFKKKHSCICELFIEKDGYMTASRDGYEWGEILLKEPNSLHKVIMKNTKDEEVIFSVVGKEIILDDKPFLLSTFSYITELENMRVKAEIAEKSKSEFLANMSHEIRTPMNGISGFLQLLEKTELSKQQEKYLEITQSSVKTLLQIINDILDFSKIESGKMSSELIEMNPFLGFEKAFIQFMPNAREKNISYQIHIDSKLDECLLIDELHIRQVMQNLINNAIKFTPEQGTVIVKIMVISQTAIHSRVQFSVKDSGIGIAKENQENIMSAFSQADNSTTRKFGGTGLGLSISSSLIKLMGGELKLESEIGEGSEFYFDLNVKKCLPSANISKHLEGKNLCLICSDEGKTSDIKHQLEHFGIAFSVVNINDTDTFLNSHQECHLAITIDDNVAKKYSKFVEIILISESGVLHNDERVDIIDSYFDCPSQLYNKLLHKEFILKDTFPHNYEKKIKLNILIAEDYEINQILLEEHLKRYGEVTYTFANNGQEALDILDTNQNFDLIFMDINMPVLDGIGATKKIRESGITIPIVALTANALDGDKERFIAEGMNGYVSKPIDFHELEKVLELYNQNDSNENKDTSNVYELSQRDIQIAIEETQNNTKFHEAVILKLLNSYIGSGKRLLISLEDALYEENNEKIARAFHDLKSSSFTLNFKQIAKMATVAEEKAIKQEKYDYQKIASYFEKHFKILKDYLEIK